MSRAAAIQWVSRPAGTAQCGGGTSVAGIVALAWADIPPRPPGMDTRHENIANGDGMIAHAVALGPLPRDDRSCGSVMMTA